MSKILFFGELPPRTIHGVSFSNEINTEILDRNFYLTKIVEFTPISTHQRITAGKIFQLLSYGLKVIATRIKRGRHDFFYLPFSISFQGAIKVLYLITIFRLMNRNAKVVLHIYRSDLPSFYRASKKNRYLVNKILKKAYKVILLSDSMVDSELRENPVFTVVANSVITAEIDIPARRSGEFLYISHYIESKGIFDLLEALGGLENGENEIKLTCYGQFTNNEEKQRILEYQSPIIAINPFIEEKRKLPEIAGCDCLILPSHNEGQPQVIFEAMSLGTPVIATRVGDIPNMLGSDYPFLVDVKSVEQIREAVLKFSRLSENEKQTLSSYVKERFRSHYSMDIHEEKLIRIFTPDNFHFNI